MKIVTWIFTFVASTVGVMTITGGVIILYEHTEQWIDGARMRLEMVDTLSKRVNELEVKQWNANRDVLHYGDAATIRVVQGDTVTFGRWSEPVAKEEGVK